MEGLILLTILLVLARGGTGSFGGFQEVTPNPPDDPVACGEWGTAVPTPIKGR